MEEALGPPGPAPDAEEDAEQSGLLLNTRTTMMMKWITGHPETTIKTEVAMKSCLVKTEEPPFPRRNVSAVIKHLCIY